MKTTIEISDALFQEAKKIAARDGTSLRTLVEQGLHHELKLRKRPARFRLRKASFRGKGMQADVRDLSWDQIRNLAYTGRGT